MALRVNRETLLSRLEPFEYADEDHEGEAQLEQMTLAGVMLTLADINHEREYELCRNAAMHLLGEVNEPEDIVLD